MLYSILVLGFLIGMQHAMEADHLAAVSSLVSGDTDLAKISWHGAVWGIGHTLTLLLVGGTCLYFKASLTESITEQLQLVVGVMLVGLGIHVLWRLAQARVHVGAHVHANGTAHLHAHSHAGETVPHARSAHAHGHSSTIPWRTLVVGTVHGLAGSAALVVLAASSLNEPSAGLAYVLLFGLGSILGMALLSAVVALPLSFTAGRMTSINGALQLTIGITTIAIGLSVVHAASNALLGIA